jgi:hypothetical protein
MIRESGQCLLTVLLTDLLVPAGLEEPQAIL